MFYYLDQQMLNILTQYTMHGTYIKVIKYVAEKIYVYSSFVGQK